jgi:hypothetical protein
MTRSRSCAAAALAVASAVTLALFCLANGVAMLLAPARWYAAVPGVILTGGYNGHFIRDIGIVYLLTGLALTTGAVRPAHRPLLWGLAAAWLGAHALFHLAEVAAGICGPDAIPRDFVGVTLPALVALGLVIFAGFRGRTVTSATPASS